MRKAVMLYIKESWLLVVSSFIFGLLLAITNAAWSGKIEHNKTAKLNMLMKSLLGGAESFQLLADDQPVKIGAKMVKTDIYIAKTADSNVCGYCFNAEGAGFADKIELVVAADGALEKIMGYSVLSSNETPGFGDKINSDFYRQQFIGASFGKLNLEKKGDDKKIDDEIIAISGATVSSNAVVNIFNNYFEQVKEAILKKETAENGR